MTDMALARIALRLRELTQACVVNEVACAAYERASEAYVQSGCEQAAKELDTTSRAWDATRDEVVKKAQILLPNLTLVLAGVPDGEMVYLRRQTESLRSAFRAEETAFLRYANISGGSTEARSHWQASRAAIIHQARGLIPHVAGLASTEVGV